MASNRIAEAIASTSVEASALEQRIIQARGEVTHLYKILLNSPAICSGWEQLLTAVRQKTSLPPRLRELIILRIAVLNRADYEFSSHVPHGRKAGLQDEDFDAVKAGDFSRFAERERHVMAYTQAMTRDIDVPDDLFESVRSQFDAAGLVELTATIAAYNMVSRFLVALSVH